MAAPGAPHTCLHHGAHMLLLFFTPLAIATMCHHLQPREDTFSWDSLQLLQAMAPSPSHPCHQYQTPLFPQALLHTKHPRHAAAAALSILQHLFTILSSTTTPRHWDAQAQHGLLNHLEHYIYHLEKCMESNRTASIRHKPRNLLLSINRYFMSIQNFLRTHHYSACAWDHVLLQAHICFQHMDTL
ncbi:IFN protein, partial [Oreotrochilus melanogaster]|nr:IFN protein [Oreotrochilus melanogaster]